MVKYLCDDDYICDECGCITNIVGARHDLLFFKCPYCDNEYGLICDYHISKYDYDFRESLGTNDTWMYSVYLNKYINEDKIGEYNVICSTDKSSVKRAYNHFKKLNQLNQSMDEELGKLRIENKELKKFIEREITVDW